MNRRHTEKKRLALIAPIEHQARALGKRVYPEHPVLTPRLEGYVDLLVADGSHETVYGALITLDLVHWNLMKAREKKADELRLIFPTGRLARAAQQRVDELKASGKAGSLSVLCLTADAAVQLLKDSNGVDVGLNVRQPSVHRDAPPKPGSKPNASAERKDVPCKFTGTTLSH